MMIQEFPNINWLACSPGSFLGMSTRGMLDKFLDFLEAQMGSEDPNLSSYRSTWKPFDDPCFGCFGWKKTLFWRVFQHKK